MKVINLMVAAFLLMTITALTTMYITVQTVEPKVIVKVMHVPVHDTIYRDTCDPKFIKTISEIESHLSTNYHNDSCYIHKCISGENEMGKGFFGIYEVAVKGTAFDEVFGLEHDDMYHVLNSNAVFWGTNALFIQHYKRKEGKLPTYVDLARMWAGGPNGYKKACTTRYKKAFEELWQLSL